MQSLIAFEMIFNTSKFKSDRSDRLCKLYGFKASNMHVIRAWFKKNYNVKLITIITMWLVVLTHCFRIAEFANNSKMIYMENALWFTFSTMFCIGFGDEFP